MSSRKKLCRCMPSHSFRISFIFANAPIPPKESKYRVPFSLVPADVVSVSDPNIDACCEMTFAETLFDTFFILTIHYVFAYVTAACNVYCSIMSNCRKSRQVSDTLVSASSLRRLLRYSTDQTSTTHDSYRRLTVGENYVRSHIYAGTQYLIYST